MSFVGTSVQHLLRAALRWSQTKFLVQLSCRAKTDSLCWRSLSLRSQEWFGVSVQTTPTFLQRYAISDSTRQMPHVPMQSTRSRCTNKNSQNSGYIHRWPVLMWAEEWRDDCQSTQGIASLLQSMDVIARKGNYYEHLCNSKNFAYSTSPTNPQTSAYWIQKTEPLCIMGIRKKDRKSFVS